jgi:glycosyltransferase involved in cell wall biosynthesis
MRTPHPTAGISISVIIPTYNRPQSLLRSLHSLQEWTLPDFEILVVDNAAASAVPRI